MRNNACLRHFAAVILPLGLLVASCGGGGGGSTTLRSISVSPDNSAIAVGMTRQYAVIGHFSNGSSLTLAEDVSWSVNPPSAAVTIDANGLATGEAVGSATIVATLDDLSDSTILTVAEAVAGNVTVWNFSNPDNRFAAFSGTAELGYRDPDATGWGPGATDFAKASALGLPLILGEDPDVMAFPETAPEQGYTLTHNSLPNGVFVDEGYVSNYTLIMDLYWPEDSSTYRGLFQTNADNDDDGEMFLRRDGAGTLGLGVGGNYNEYAAFGTGSWHRVAVAVQCAIGLGGTGQIHKYVDGLFVGGQLTPEQFGASLPCRWALDNAVYLFTDDDGDTAPGYVSSILFVDRLMFPDEIKALGGPRAAGAGVPGEAAVSPRMASRRVLNFSHRTQSGSAPENTLEGIQQAFDVGADHVEVDVRKTADGKLVLFHDEDLDRTTDGSGPLSGINLVDLQALDAGTWFDPGFSSAYVPTLKEALDVLAINPGKKFLLDVKTNLAGEAIAQALSDAGVTDDRVWPAGDDSDAAAADFQTWLPEAGILASPEPPLPTEDAEFDALKSKGFVGFDIDQQFVTSEFVEDAQRNGMIVVAYTILSPDEMFRMIDLGVDGMETDFPAVLDSLMPTPPN